MTFGRWRYRTVTVVVHGCRWTQAASGAAGRANVELCPASSNYNVMWVKINKEREQTDRAWQWARPVGVVRCHGDSQQPQQLRARVRLCCRLDCPSSSALRSSSYLAVCSPLPARHTETLTRSTPCLVVWRPRRAADTSTNRRLGFLCRRTASMEHAAIFNAEI